MNYEVVNKTISIDERRKKRNKDMERKISRNDIRMSAVKRRKRKSNKAFRRYDNRKW